MTEHPPARPWYRQLCPWFIIAFPESSVAAGTAMVFIAFNNADTLVRDDYYRDGLAINEELARDRRARELGLSASVRFDSTTGEVVVDLANDTGDVEAMQLLLLHPVDEARDRVLDVKRVVPGRYRSDLDTMPRDRFYVRLQPAGDSPWRLNGEVDFGISPTVLLSPDV